MKSRILKSQPRPIHAFTPNTTLNAFKEHRPRLVKQFIPTIYKPHSSVLHSFPSNPHGSQITEDHKIPSRLHLQDQNLPRSTIALPATSIINVQAASLSASASSKTCNLFLSLVMTVLYRAALLSSYARL